MKWLGVMIAGNVNEGNASVLDFNEVEYPGGSRDWGLVETLHLGATFFEAATDFSLFTTTTSTVNHSAT